MTPRILLFGSTGQIGRALAPRLYAFGSLTALTRADANLSRPETIAEIINAARPNLVVNAAAYTSVDRAESEPASAQRINAEAVAEISVASAKAGAAVIHFSTDYVYDGTKREPYVESDATNPLSVYGRTKLAGDCVLAGVGVPHLIFRTTWVYTADGRNFRNAIIARARETRVLRVVNDQVGAPTTAESIANGVMRVLERISEGGADLADGIASLSGVYHMTARGETTWYDFARAILEREKIDATVDPISTELLGAPARRPAYSVLDNTKLSTTFGVELPDWRAQLEAVSTGGA